MRDQSACGPLMRTGSQASLRSVTVASSGHNGLLPGQRMVKASIKTGPLPLRQRCTASTAAACTAFMSVPSTFRQ